MIIKSANYVIGGTKISHFPTDNLPEVLFVGRSNVGKSSFINALCNKTIARTSSNPGKTQVINFFMINDSFYFVDVPGYGYARVSKTKIEEFGKMIENYITNRVNLKAVFLLVDFKVGPTKDDILMYEFLKYYNKKIYIICTKSDKVNMSNKEKTIKNITSKLNIDRSSLIITSSEKKIGLDKCLDLIEELVG
ncbi:MAG: ribosome biogenesis GTP-binding protein YihA/YsxC [bacterium]|nr:ribosome biogenesis GTP-binding protein YihA/YsxC [bacterium]